MRTHQVRHQIKCICGVERWRQRQQWANKLDFLTMLSSRRSNIPDARSQLALSSFMGRFTRAIAGAASLLSVMLGSSSFSRSTNSTATAAGPIKTHGADLLLLWLLLVVVVQHWQTTLLVTDEGEEKVWAGCSSLWNLSQHHATLFLNIVATDFFFFFKQDNTKYIWWDLMETNGNISLTAKLFTWACKRLQTSHVNPYRAWVMQK